MEEISTELRPSRLGVPVMVLHVREGYEARAASVEAMLARLGIDFSYVLEGDIPDLDESTVTRNFSGAMRRVSGETSCAMKHLLAYRRLLDSGLPGALILEDDIALKSKFPAFFAECMREAETRGIGDMLLSFEDTSMQFVRGSQRRKGVRIYAAERDRYAGCYYVTSGVARLILDHVAAHGCHLPIDRFHTFLIGEAGLPYYWTHPTVATQGSKNGKFGSSISMRDARRQLYMHLTTPLKKAYKKLLYKLR